MARSAKLSCCTEFECIKSLGDTQNTQSARFKSHTTKCRPAAGGSNQSDAASSSQLWLTDAKVEQTCEENSLLQERTRIRVFKNVQGNLPQKIPKSTTRTTRHGRTITAYLVLAAVHLGSDDLDNSHSNKKQPRRTVKQRFEVTRVCQRTNRNSRYHLFAK